MLVTADNLPSLCDILSAADPDLAKIITVYGYPPFWNRPNTFETLVHIILEQQVSLASALAALQKLRDRIGMVTPERVLEIADDEFTGLYISRQKRTYIQGLATALIQSELNLDAIATRSDEAVVAELTSLNGIGQWTADIYLIMVLHRPDHFPAGDIAAVNACKNLKQLAPKTDRETVVKIAESWQPHRSVATMLLWHYYLNSKGRPAPVY